MLSKRHFLGNKIRTTSFYHLIFMLSKVSSNKLWNIFTRVSRRRAIKLCRPSKESLGLITGKIKEYIKSNLIRAMFEFYMKFPMINIDSMTVIMTILWRLSNLLKIQKSTRLLKCHLISRVQSLITRKTDKMSKLTIATFSLSALNSWVLNWSVTWFP